MDLHCGWTEHPLVGGPGGMGGGALRAGSAVGKKKAKREFLNHRRRVAIS